MYIICHKMKSYALTVLVFTNDDNAHCIKIIMT